MVTKVCSEYRYSIATTHLGPEIQSYGPRLVLVVHGDTSYIVGCMLADATNQPHHTKSNRIFKTNPKNFTTEAKVIVLSAQQGKPKGLENHSSTRLWC